MSVAKSLASRADLLRWARRYGRESLAEVAFLAGYEVVASPPDSEPAECVSNDDAQNIEHTHPPPLSNADPGKRPAEPFYHVISRERSSSQPNEADDPAEAHIPPSIRGIPPFTDNDPALQIPADAPPPLPWLPIVPEARLVPFLRRILSQPGARRLDLPGLVQKVSRLEPLHRIPTTHKTIPAGQVTLLLDLNDRMLPFWEDGHALCKSIELKHGRVGLDIRTLRDDPEGRHGHWFNSSQPPRSWTMPPAGSVVLIVSDLGQLARDAGIVRRAWLRLGERLLRCGLHPVVLTPVAPAQRVNALERYYRQVHWDRSAPLVEAAAKAGEGRVFEQAERLLGLLSPAIHVEPELLRAVCRLLPAPISHSGVEAAVWLHPDVFRGYTAFQLRAEKRLHCYLDKFRNEPPHLQKQVLRLIKRHHARQFPSVWARELLSVQEVVKFPIEEIGDPDVAERFFKRFTHTFFKSRENESMALYARRDLGRQSENQLTEYTYNSILYALANQEALKEGRCNLPRWVTSAEVWAVVAKSRPPEHYDLVQRGEALYLSPPGNDSGGRLAALTLNTDRMMVDGVFHAVDTNKPIAELSAERTSVLLDTGRERIHISAMTKPPWVAAMGWNSEGLSREIESRQSVLHRTYWHPPELGEELASLRGVWYPEPPGAVSAPAWAQAMGRDRYGIYADFVFKGVQQRMRWIEPGHFLMGSPENEAGRYDDEVQHEVTVSQGFWLADTTVTQALWRAVMGDDPSHFKGDSRPVEQVGWEDVQAFIEKLNRTHSDLTVGLPTEAQWEYACRGGGTGLFNFEGELSLEKVNYRGTWEYDSDKWSEGARRETAEVKSYPCNAWGLYEMHGNVWEWCGDYWQEQLSVEPVVDPEGPQEGVTRVVRGGSWVDLGRFVRSSFRNHLAPDYRRGNLGFRLSLGHELRPPGKPGSGASRSSASRGLPGGLRRLLGRWKK